MTCIVKFKNIVRQYDFDKNKLSPILIRKCVLLYVQDGVHTVKKSKKHTAEALKLMKTQDLNYINSKRSMEAKVVFENYL